VSHSTCHRSFYRRSCNPSQSIDWCKEVFPTNHLAGTSKTNTTTSKWQNKKKPKPQLMKLQRAKLNLMQLKPDLGRLLSHPARKRNCSTRPGAHPVNEWFSVRWTDARTYWPRRPKKYAEICTMQMLDGSTSSDH